VLVRVDACIPLQSGQPLVKSGLRAVQ